MTFSFLQRAMREAIDAAGVTLIEELSHHFEPEGFTLLALLSESHMSVHTWQAMDMRRSICLLAAGTLIHSCHANWVRCTR
jgi:S-adenosylmethionine/arginine decarboxylase-like enzyme